MIGSMVHSNRTDLPDGDRRAFLRALGVGGAAAAGGVTFDELRAAVDAERSGSFAAMGESIRSDLSGRLDPSLLGDELSNVAAGIERLPALAAAGTLDEPGDVYHELAAPAWTVYDHLAATGFFGSAEENLPRFSEEHVAASARRIVHARAVEAALSDAGFGDEEMVALVSNVVTNAGRLSSWVPTSDLPRDATGFDPAHVAPLHQRAIGGALLWIDELDQHLWQRRRLITDEMVAAGLDDVKVMLGGTYLVARAAHDVAGPNELSDGALAATLTAGAALAIVGQEDVAADLFRITDGMRAPRGGDAR